MLFFNLSPILQARGIRKTHSFLVKAGISSRSANSMLSGNMRVIRLDQIERICKALNCEPNDLLTYAPEEGQSISTHHPLHNLIRNNTEEDLQSTLANIPYKQLKAIKQQIDESTNELNDL